MRVSPCERDLIARRASLRVFSRRGPAGTNPSELKILPLPAIPESFYKYTYFEINVNPIVVLLKAGLLQGQAYTKNNEKFKKQGKNVFSE